MSLFNKFKRKKAVKTVNKAGGEAYVQSAKMRLVSLLLTSFAKKQYYRSGKETFDELAVLLSKVDAEFAAKAAVYARRTFGMRSITHVLAGELARYTSGKVWAKDFYAAIIKRPDDMLEIAAYYFNNGGKNLPNAMKKGFAKAFDQFDGYQLAKYRGENKQVKLVDLVNIVHPIPTKRNAKALSELVKGTLRNTETWESKLTQAGKSAKSDQEKATNKTEAWADLILTNKIGYFALLRNLRNIIEQAPGLIDSVCDLITRRNSIKRSLVLPFRYLSAIDALKESGKTNRKIHKALNEALEIALDNVPVFEGKTLIALDDSGSMTGWSQNKSQSPIAIGSIFAAILYKTNDADLMTFSNSAKYNKFHYGDAVASISERLIKSATSGGTNFHAIFEKANKPYDRVIILSDMQAWVGHYSPKRAFEQYQNKFGVRPHIYSFDLNGQGSLQFPENKVYALAGFSDKVFDLMKYLEKDRKALMKTIEAVSF